MRMNASRLAMTLLLVAATLGGCSWDGENHTATPERKTLRIGVTTSIDTVPLRMAVANGDFDRAGLPAELLELPATGTGLDGIKTGNLDVTIDSNVELFNAAASGEHLQLQGEAFSAGNNSIALVRSADSDYTDTTSKKAPVIAVNQLDGVGTLTSSSVLAAAGVDPANIKFVERDFTRMTDDLRTGKVDAAWMTEPYITEAAWNFGATILTDCASGATADFPLSSYASSSTFAKANARSLATFRTVLNKAQQAASDNRNRVRTQLPTQTGIEEPTAAVLSLGNYPTSLNGVRLQRVADLMHSRGVIQRRLDVPSLLPG